MNIKSGFKLCTIILAAAVATGCATNESQRQGAIGAGLGCVGGALLTTAMGGKPAQGCAVGALAGGAIGYYNGRQADMALARSIEREIQSSMDQNSQVVVQTRSIPVPQEERAQVGNASQIEVMDKMVVSVPTSLVTSRDARAANTFSRVGNYVANSSAPTKVVVRARTDAEYNYIVNSIRSGYGNARVSEPGKVAYQFARVDRGSQSSVEVMNA